MELLQRSAGQAKEVRIGHRLLRVRHLAQLLLLECELLLDALFAERFILDHHDGLREVHLAQVHLDRIGEEGLHWHVGLLLLGFRLFLPRAAVALTVDMAAFRRQTSFVFVAGSWLFSLINHFLIRTASGLPEGRELLRVAHLLVT